MPSSNLYLGIAGKYLLKRSANNLNHSIYYLINSMVMFTFIQINGWRLVVPEPEVVVTMQQVAAGEISETLLADWLRENSLFR